jgi:CubicO group peptidase (beta-lactamase class C family)
MNSPLRRPAPHSFQHVDEALERVIRTQQLVGAVAMISVGGELQYQRAVGFADRELKCRMRPDSIFRWASLTKAIVAAATLRLVEHGELSLNDAVTEYLPEFRPRLPDGEAPTITLRHLITHTAGLTYGMFESDAAGPYHRAGVSDGMDQLGLPLKENLRRIASVPLLRAPGSGWGYSVATDVLGACLERATRESLPEIVKSLVTDPLDMTDSGFSVTDLGRLATPYAPAEQGFERMRGELFVPFNGGALSFVPARTFDLQSYKSAGSGMVGTATDFLCFLEAMRTGGGPVLRPQSVQALSVTGPKDFETFVPGWKWPIGWAVLVDPQKTHTPQSVGSWMWGGVYGCSWFVDPARELSVVLMSNTAVAGMMGEAPNAIRNAVYDSLGG